VSRISTVRTQLPVLILFFIAGCGGGEPTVATDVPKVEITPAPDLSRGRPKGMPKTATTGLKVDPATGRPMQ
jgi:hypothetical protein